MSVLLGSWVALAKAKLGLVGPRIVVEDRNFDDAGWQFQIGVADLRFDVFQSLHHLVRMNHVRSKRTR